MGLRGPQPQPTAVRELRGDPGKRGRPAGEEPRPEPAAPKMPRGLPREARAFWRRYADGLAKLGLLTEVDTPAFTLMAMHWQVCQDAMRSMAVEGKAPAGGALELTTEDEDGLERKHPLLQVLRDNSSAFLRYAAHFGMSPSARAGMRVEPPAVVDPYEVFLGRKNGRENGGAHE